MGGSMMALPFLETFAAPKAAAATPAKRMIFLGGGFGFTKDTFYPKKAGLFAEPLQIGLQIINQNPTTERLKQLGGDPLDFASSENSYSHAVKVKAHQSPSRRKSETVTQDSTTRPGKPRNHLLESFL